MISSPADEVELCSRLAGVVASLLLICRMCTSHRTDLRGQLNDIDAVASEALDLLWGGAQRDGEKRTDTPVSAADQAAGEPGETKGDRRRTRTRARRRPSAILVIEDGEV